MAKGSVRKKGKKWYYRFYVEDASGNLVQKECVGTESKSETEKLLRQAMDDYEKKKFVAKAENLTVGQLLDVWAEEELKTGTLSNGTVENYLGTIRNIKKHPLAERKLKNVTSEHLQSFFDLLSFGGVHPDGKERKGYSKDYIVKSPVRRIHKVKTAKVIKETYSDETLEIMRDNCCKFRDLAMIDLLASSGMRVGEMVTLNRDDINFNERECVVFGKGSKERIVYFDARTKILCEWRKVFCLRISKGPNWNSKSCFPS